MVNGVNGDGSNNQNYEALLARMKELDRADNKADNIISYENAKAICKEYNIDISNLSIFLVDNRNKPGENSQIYAGYFTTDKGDYVVSIDGEIYQSHDDPRYNDTPEYYESRKENTKEIKKHIYIGAMINAIVQNNPFKYGFGNKTQ